MSDPCWNCHEPLRSGHCPRCDVDCGDVPAPDPTAAQPDAVDTFLTENAGLMDDLAKHDVHYGAAARADPRDQRIAELERLCNGEIEMREHVEAERDRARAERDAAVEALEWIESEGMDDGDIHGCDQFTLAEAAIMLLNRAREALARLPHATERAQAVLDVITAARFLEHDLRTGGDGTLIQGRRELTDALARLDALDGGGGA